MADATTLYILYESAIGYALYEVISYDEVSALLADSGGAATMMDLSRFSRCMKLYALTTFTTAIDALENCNAISEHIMSTTLYNFLELHLPKTTKGSSKKSSTGSSKSTAPYSLGVIDPILGNAIVEGFAASSTTSIACRSDDMIREMIRGCRYHFDTFMKGYMMKTTTGDDVTMEDATATSTATATPASSSTQIVTKKAQLGLGHSYSRAKVKFNPARSDNMIIQCIALMDVLDKNCNTFIMRIKEWYSYHFPELKAIVKDNVIYARAAAFIQDKSTLLTAPTTKEGEDGGAVNTKFQQLSAIVGDDDTANLIVTAAKTSMGMDCNVLDMMNIVNFTQRLIKMMEYRKQLQYYLSDKMNIVAPNLSALIGDTVAARLISKAGSLMSLAKAPASTVQILGAEKALFRALKTKGNTPKYGLIYHSTFIGRADSKNKGRISRYLANKCSIATRIDSFSDDTMTGAPTSRLYGEKLRDQVEERLKFYETGASPRRNIDVMEEVSKVLKAASATTSVDTPKSKKKKSKEAMDIDDDEEDNDNDADIDKEATKSDKKKKKKDKKRKSMDNDDNDDDNKKAVESKKIKKSDAVSADVVEVEGEEKVSKSAKKEKKDKKKKKSM